MKHKLYNTYYKTPIGARVTAFGDGTVAGWSRNGHEMVTGRSRSRNKNTSVVDPNFILGHDQIFGS